MKKTIQYIYSHPLNKSQTKQSHAFTKSPRFGKVKQSNCSSSFYNVSKSATKLKKPNTTVYAFSKSQRFKNNQTFYPRDQKTPSPASYKSPDFIQISKKKKRGVSFNHSPKSLKSQSLSPGPGYYKIQKYNPQNKHLISITKQQRKTLNTHWNKVGPGQYDVNKQDRHHQSAFIGNSRRFQDREKQVKNQPAPGQYFTKNSADTQISIRSKSPTFSFATAKKKTIFQPKPQISPGPGSYNTQFSQFSQRSKRIREILNRL